MIQRYQRMLLRSRPAETLAMRPGLSGSERDSAHEGQAKPFYTRRPLRILFGVMVIGLATILLYRTLSQYSYQEIISSLRSVPMGNILMAGLFTAASYLCLTGFDFLAVRYVNRPLPYWQTALTSFTSLSMGHSIGFAGLSSGAIRYRFYSRWGLTAEEVAKVVLFCGLTVGLGLMILGGFGLLIRSDLASRMTGLPQEPLVLFGILLLALSATYVLLAAWISTPLKLWKWQLAMPPLRLALAQMLIGPLNFALVAACFHQLLTAIADLPYLETVAAYVLANTATIMSHVPGGLGIIESVVFFVLPGIDLIGPLLVFRVVYFLIPLMLGLATLMASEAALRTGSPSP